MAQKNGQIREQALHLSALSVPRDETVNRESMAQVMNPRFVARTVNAMDAGMRRSCSSADERLLRHTRGCRTVSSSERLLELRSLSHGYQLS